MKLIVGVILAGLAGSATGAERITREEMLEDMARSIKFSLCCDETISEDEVESVRAAVLRDARSADFLPEALDNLPDGTRAEVLGRPLFLSSKDIEYCILQSQAHLMAMIAGCEMAKEMPLLDDAAQRDLIAKVDRVLARASTAMKNHLEPLLRRDEIDQWMGRERAGIVAAMQSRVQVRYKRLPTDDELDRIATEFEQRVGESASLEFNEARRRWPGSELSGYRGVPDSFRQRIFMSAMFHLLLPLQTCTSISTEGFRFANTPFYARFESVKGKAAEMEGRETEKRIAWHFARFRRMNDEVARRRGVGRWGPVARDAGNPPLTPPAAGWQARIELPASRPATQPAGA
ncbi:MAG: hypothetical protein ACPMAQ_10420, partial [Phycisphaerae bacterium]